MTTTTSSSTDLDALLGAVLDVPLWIEEPPADRLDWVLLLDSHAALPRDHFEEANRSDLSAGLSTVAKVFFWVCHAAVRRRADEVGFKVKRIVALLGRCVDLPADIAEKIRNLLRDGLLRNETRNALVGILRAAGACTAARAIAAPVENHDDDGHAEAAVEKRQTKKEAERLDHDDEAILKACGERRKDQREIEVESGVSFAIVKKRTRLLKLNGWLRGKRGDGWIRTAKATRYLKR